MKRVIVKNLDGVQTHGADMEDPTQWIAECQSTGAWGLDYTVEVIDLGYLSNATPNDPLSILQWLII